MPISSDILITNASAITMDRARPRAEAVALHQGRISFVGSNADAAAWRGPKTRVIDAQGYTLLPGLIDSHYHLLWGSLNLDGMQFPEAKSYTEFGRQVREYAAAHPDRPWLTGYQLSYTLVPAPERLTRHHLDALVADRPLFVIAFDMHTAWANTKALEIAGILQGATCPPGNEVVMGEDGLATGELREFDAYNLVRDSIPKPDAAQTRDLLRQGMALTASYGITSVHNMDGSLDQFLRYAALEADGDLTLRVYVPLWVTPETPKAALVEEALVMRDCLAQRGQYSTKVRSNCVKYFMDGVIESYTSQLVDPYADSPTLGSTIWEPAHFTEMAVASDQLGLQIITHAIGDASIRHTLDGYAQARQVNGHRDSRHRIEHIELLHPDDLPRFAQLGVIASMQPLHAHSAQPGEVWASRVGSARWQHAFPWQSLRASGAHLTFGSDWPVVTQNPFLGFDTALNRHPWSPSDPVQAQSLMGTLAAYTSAGAYTEFQEGVKGQLRPGMYADLVLLAGNIETTPADAVHAMQVALTICDGQIVYEG